LYVAPTLCVSLWGGRMSPAMYARPGCLSG
jgi:hypothetical protein